MDEKKERLQSQGLLVSPADEAVRKRHKENMKCGKRGRYEKRGGMDNKQERLRTQGLLVTFAEVAEPQTTQGEHEMREETKG
jgi:hypothetical protein